MIKFEAINRDTFVEFLGGSRRECSFCNRLDTDNVDCIPFGSQPLGNPIYVLFGTSVIVRREMMGDERDFHETL